MTRSEANTGRRDHRKVETLGGTPRSGVRMVAEPPTSLDFEERLLDEAQLRAHLRELEAQGEVLHVTLKYDPRTKARACLLSELILPLANNEAFGAQVEFTQSGHRWLDTLISTLRGIRLVRLQITA